MGKDRTDAEIAERAQRKAAKAKAKSDKAPALTTAGETPKEKKRPHTEENAQSEAPKKKKKHSVTEEAADDDDSDNGDESLEAVTKPLYTKFAQPLASEKHKEKLLKAVRRAAHQGALKRGVKEISKTTRKTKTEAAGSYKNASAIAILAADVFPEEVIAHLPVLCEDHSIPFIFIDSRRQLGEAGATKRPTSCLLLQRQNKDGTADDTWAETYNSVLKLVRKEREKCYW